MVTFSCPVGKGSSILNGQKVSEFQKYCSENFHSRQWAEGLQSIFCFLAKRKSRRNGLFSKAGESLKYLWGSVFWLDLQVQIYLVANFTGISEVMPVYLQAEFAQTENRSFWQRHFITFRNYLNVEVILVDTCFTSFYIICKHSGLQNWNYEPPSIGSHLNKWLDFSPPRSAVNRQGSAKAVATQQLWSLSFPFKWIKMKLGDTGRSCGLHLEIWVCPQLHWGQYNFIYPFCLFNSRIISLRKNLSHHFQTRP